MDQCGASTCLFLKHSELLFIERQIIFDKRSCYARQNEIIFEVKAVIGSTDLGACIAMIRIPLIGKTGRIFFRFIEAC